VRSAEVPIRRANHARSGSAVSRRSTRSSTAEPSASSGSARFGRDEWTSTSVARKINRSVWETYDNR